MHIIDWQNIELTDELIAKQKARVGVKRHAKAWNSLVTHDAIWHLANGIGDDNPLWRDPEYAKKTRWGGQIAPPYYAYCVNSAPDPDVKDRLGLPGILGIWAGDSWEWYRPVRPGDVLSAETFFAKVTEHRSTFGGKAVQQVVQSDFTNQRGEPVAKYQQTLRRFARSATRGQQKYMEAPPAAYTVEELNAMEAEYALEAARRRGAVPRYPDGVRVGEEVNPMLKGPITVTTLTAWLMGWGSPYCLTNRMLFTYLKDHTQDLLMDPSVNIPDTIEAAHWDTFFARQSGIPRGYDFGAMRCSWFIHQMCDWMGDDAFLRSIDAKFIRPVLLGDTCRLSGQVAEKLEKEGAPLVRCELKMLNQRHELVAVASAVVELPKKK